MNREAKIALVTRAMSAVYAGNDPDTLRALYAANLKQHDPRIGDGLQGMLEFAASVGGQGPAALEIHRAFVDGDHVVMHSTIHGFPASDAPQIAFDVFRLEAGKIVEHWGGHEDLAPPNPSGRTQVDGPTQVSDLGSTEANRALVRAFKQAITVEQKFAEITNFIQDGRYAQHASKVGDGIARLKNRIREVNASQEQPVLDPRLYFAEGDFVLSIVDAQAAAEPTANYDLFRCEDGWIVEHWDVLSHIPPRNEWKNENGPY